MAGGLFMNFISQIPLNLHSLSRALAVTFATALAVVFAAVPAGAVGGAGTFTFAGGSTTATCSGTPCSVNGTFVTATGETGSFTLTRNSSSGYLGTVNFYATPSGISILNQVCTASSGGCVDGGDRYSYTLSLTPTAATTRLVTEVIQGGTVNATTNTQNIDPSNITLSYSGAPSGSTASASLITNTSVPLLVTSNGSYIMNAGASQPQVRVNTGQQLVYNGPGTLPSTSYPAMAEGTSLSPGSVFTLFGVVNSASQFKVDVVNATQITVNSQGILQGTSGGVSSTAIGETYNEWIGFGVRTLNPAQLTLKKSVTARDGANDNFTVQIKNGATVVASATTGSTGTSAATAPQTLSSNVNYTLTEIMGTGTLANYGKTISCANSTTGSSTTMPSGVSATPSWTLATQAGDVIECTITNAPAVALTVTKTNTPASGVSDLPADTVISGTNTIYSVVVSNAGPSRADGTTISDTPGAGLSNCVVLDCTASGSATCPATPGDIMTAPQSIPALPSGGSVTIRVQCKVD